MENHYTQRNGRRQAWLTRPGQGGPLLFLHATGFHGGVWEPLLHAMPGRPAMALDLRGHGRSDASPPPYRWQDFADDVIALIGEQGWENLTLVGHSMGGHLAVLIAAALPDRIRHIVLLDPVILAADMLRMRPPPGFEHPVARRRAAWSSVAELQSQLQTKPPYNRFAPEVLTAYCARALRAVGDAFTLACAPQVEAAIYMAEGHEGIYDAMPKVTCAVDILRARDRLPEEGFFEFGASTTYAGVGTHFSAAASLSEEQWGDCSHFLPLECPQRVADWIMDRLDRGAA